VLLDDPRRALVEAAIRETCKIRNWALYTINVRTNHVHVVTAINGKNPETALNAFKANATRQMRSAGLWRQAETPWAEKGSKRYLWNEKSIEQAIEYVLNGQGDDLPKFD
jgi:REP element-mobilizing transposase RayT